LNGKQSENKDFQILKLTILSQDLFFARGLDDCLELVFIAAVQW
jgi:hypothetical protein